MYFTFTLYFYKFTFGQSGAAPPPVTSLFNGFGTWNCTKYGTPETCFTRKPFELQVYRNKKYRLRLINTASHGGIPLLHRVIRLTFLSPSNDMELG